MDAIKFLSAVTKVFETALDEEDFTDQLLGVFKKYFEKNNVNISHINIYVWDKVSKRLKYFTKSWEILEFDTNKDTPLDDFEFFTKNLNETYKLAGTNKITLPLKNKGETIGVFEATYSLKGPFEATKGFTELAKITMEQIALAVINMQTIEKMQITINFHQATKNIAKIIETQYEINYILPIIGEMIDNFIYGHLIYIFLKVPGKKDYKLVWPAHCSSKNVFEHLKKLGPKSDTIIEEDGKMGIFPLSCEGKLIGAIVSYNHFDKLTEVEIEYLEKLVRQSSETVDRAHSYMKILQHATLDALTGLNNRHQFAHRLKQEVATAKRQNSPLCCMMMDVDHFKSVNDTYGHAVGDLVLKTVSKVIKKEIREYDIASRYGGEEFSVILPNTGLDEAFLVANRLRKAMERKKVNIEEYGLKEKEVSVTISIGINSYDKTKPMELLYQDADKALYEAKKRGRNRVVVFEENKK